MSTSKTTATQPGGEQLRAGSDDDDAPKATAGEDPGEARDTSTSEPLNLEDPHGEVPSPDPHEDQEDIPYPEPSSPSEIPHPPSFKPFFALIEDPITADHHHPTVHYIFSDDDPDILTNAALHTISQESDERFIILDLDPSGKEVVSSASLSPDWQAVKTSISPAPSWGGGEDGGWMLRVEGESGKKKRGGDLDGLLKAFDEQLENLEGVLGKGVGDEEVEEEVREEADTQQVAQEADSRG